MCVLVTQQLDPLEQSKEKVTCLYTLVLEALPTTVRESVSPTHIQRKNIREFIDSFKLPQPNTSGKKKDEILIKFFSSEHKNWVSGRGAGEFYFVPFADIKGTM